MNNAEYVYNYAYVAVHDTTNHFIETNDSMRGNYCGPLRARP